MPAIPPLAITVHSYWRAVLMGRQLFVRGFWHNDQRQEARLRHLLEPHTWANRTFYLRWVGWRGGGRVRGRNVRVRGRGVACGYVG